MNNFDSNKDARIILPPLCSSRQDVWKCTKFRLKNQFWYLNSDQVKAAWKAHCYSHVLCFMSPFQSRGTSWVAEKVISVKNRSDAVSLVMSYLRVLDLTRLIFSQGLRKVCLISSAKFQRDLPCVSTTISEKKTPVRVRHPRPALCGREGNF